MTEITDPRILTLAGLEPGWDEGGTAPALDRALLGRAQRLIERVLAEGYERPSIFPSYEGGIAFEWASAAAFTSIEFASELSPTELFTLRFDGPVKLFTTDADTVFAYGEDDALFIELLAHAPRA